MSSVPMSGEMWVGRKIEEAVSVSWSFSAMSAHGDLETPYCWISSASEE